MRLSPPLVRAAGFLRASASLRDTFIRLVSRRGAEAQRRSAKASFVSAHFRSPALLAVLSALTFLTTSPAASAQATLTVVAELSKPPKPDLRLIVLACPEMNSFESGYNCWEVHADAQSPITRVEIDSIPPGTYAIKVFVDENANGKLDLGWNGIPDEPCGFSGTNNRISGVPTFPMAMITITGGKNVQRIRLQ